MTGNNGRTIVGVLAIFIGAAIFYCNSRITRLETSLQKQQQVLSSFIANIQQTMHQSSNQNTINGGGQETNTIVSGSLSSAQANLAAEQHLNSASIENASIENASIENASIENANSKIVVTESEKDSDSDSVSDSDSDSDSSHTSSDDENDNSHNDNSHNDNSHNDNSHNDNSHNDNDNSHHLEETKTINLLEVENDSHTTNTDNLLKPVSLTDFISQNLKTISIVDSSNINSSSSESDSSDDSMSHTGNDLVNSDEDSIMNNKQININSAAEILLSIGQDPLVVESVNALSEIDAIDSLSIVDVTASLPDVDVTASLSEVDAVASLPDVDAAPSLSEVDAVASLLDVDAVASLPDVDAVASLPDVDAAASLPEVDNTDYNRLRVIDLKKIANEKLLAPTTKINSMKKQQLINLITNKG